MFSNQKLFLVNHFALAARRAGITLPELTVMFEDEVLLKSHIDRALTSAHAPVVEAARAVAVAFNWRGAPAGGSGASAPRTSAPAEPPMTTAERMLAKEELLKVVGPIADFIVDQIGDTERMSLRRFLTQAGDLAELSADKRRELFAACGLEP